METGEIFNKVKKIKYLMQTFYQMWHSFDSFYIYKVLVFLSELMNVSFILQKSKVYMYKIINNTIYPKNHFFFSISMDLR